jgi:V-type H+-transporting ATPase subunit F
MESLSGLLVAVIGDKDTVAGFLLAGVGKRDDKEQNWFIVDPESKFLFSSRATDVISETSIEAIENAFNTFTKRRDIAVIMINQSIANEIRHVINRHVHPIPTVLEIPSKDMAYDPAKDKIMSRVKQLLGKD